MGGGLCPVYSSVGVIYVTAGKGGLGCDYSPSYVVQCPCPQGVGPKMGLVWRGVVCIKSINSPAIQPCAQPLACSACPGGRYYGDTVGLAIANCTAGYFCPLASTNAQQCPAHPGRTPLGELSRADSGPPPHRRATHHGQGQKAAQHLDVQPAPGRSSRPRTSRGHPQRWVHA
jgi:hypothetical protein